MGIYKSIGIREFTELLFGYSDNQNFTSRALTNYIKFKLGVDMFMYRSPYWDESTPYLNTNNMLNYLIDVGIVVIKDRKGHYFTYSLVKKRLSKFPKYQKVTYSQ